ncbi:MAG: hypothetical protein KC620_14025 [Myxococcales bacterium]|nr:hypothetical protein [Myxococcales bacterium]
MTRRFTLAWAAALGALGFGLCFVPLFDLLGYEFSFTCALLVTLCAGACGVRARRGLPDAPWRAWAAALRQALPLAAVPLLPITLNALRVRNCDYVEGLVFYALLPGGAAVVASGVGVAVARLAPRRGVAVFVALYAATIALSIWRFYADPPIDVFHLFAGYYPGALYDDIILIDDRLLWSRAEDLVGAALLVGISGLRRGGLRPWLLGGVLAIAGLGVRHLATRHAVHRDADYVRSVLGGRLDTEHLHIYYPKRWSPQRIDHLGLELEFVHAELAAFFGFAPKRPIDVYLYGSAATKKRLMGARNVRVAKPWQWAFHVHGPEIGQSVLPHEMAHVFSAELVGDVLRVPMHRGVVPDMPLIEGLAEAAAPRPDRLDAHDWSAAMRVIGVAPPLAEVLEPTGFYGRNSRTAYTLCGSFARHYRDTAGADALAEAYGRGSFERPGGPSLTALVAEWEAFVDARPQSPQALAHARARFDAPAIFGRVCAHEIADLRREAARAARKGDMPDALATTEAILGHLPRDVRARLDRVDLLLQLDRRDEAEAAARAVSADEPAGAVARAHADETLADLAALAGRTDEAAAGYAAVTALAFERADLRRLAAKREALAVGETGRAALRYLIEPHATADAEARRAAVEALVAAAPDWPLARYLRGRAALQAGRLLDGLTDLFRVEPILTDASLRFESARLRAAAVFGAGCYAYAAGAFAALAERTDADLTESERAELRAWTRRARFFGARRAPPSEPCADVDKAAAAAQDAARPAE